MAWLIDRLCEGRPIFGAGGRAPSDPGLAAAIVRALHENPCFQRIGARRAAWRSLARMQDAGGEVAFGELLEAVTDPEVGREVAVRLAAAAPRDRLVEVIVRVDNVLTDAPTSTVARWTQVLRALGREAQALAPHLERVVQDESLSWRERARALGALASVAGGAEALAAWELLPSRDLRVLREGLAEYVVATLGTLEAPPAVRQRFQDYLIEMIRANDPELHHELLAIALYVFSRPESIVPAPGGGYWIDPKLERQLREVIDSHPDQQWREQVASLLDSMHRSLPEWVRLLRERGLSPGVPAPPLKLGYSQAPDSALAAARAAAARDPAAVRHDLLQWVQLRHGQYRRVAAWIGTVEPWSRLVQAMPDRLLDIWDVEWFRRSFDQTMQAFLEAGHRSHVRSKLPLDGRVALVGLARTWTPTEQRLRRAARLQKGCGQLRQQLLGPFRAQAHGGPARGASQRTAEPEAGRDRTWRPLVNWARILATSIFYARAAAALDDPKWDRDEAWREPVGQLVEDLLRGERQVPTGVLEDPEFQQLLAEALLWKVASVPPQDTRGRAAHDGQSEDEQTHEAGGTAIVARPTFAHRRPARPGRAPESNQQSPYPRPGWPAGRPQRRSSVVRRPASPPASGPPSRGCIANASPSCARCCVAGLDVGALGIAQISSSTKAPSS